jgi:hypothetical protein
MSKVAILIKNIEQQYEGLRTSIGLLGQAKQVQIFVIRHSIESIGDYFCKNRDLLLKACARCFSDNPVNVEKFGFEYLTTAEIGEKLKEADFVIPF